MEGSDVSSNGGVSVISEIGRAFHLLEGAGIFVPAQAPLTSGALELVSVYLSPPPSHLPRISLTATFVASSEQGIH